MGMSDQIAHPGLNALNRTNSEQASAARQHNAARVILSIALAVAMPVFLFAGWMAYVTADRERAESRSAAVATVNRVADQVTAALLKELEIAEALGTSANLDASDTLPSFYKEAQRLTAARPLWETVALAAPDGTNVLNILRPMGAALGTVADQRSFEDAVRQQRSAIGGIGPVAPFSGKRLVSLRVPIKREGTLRYILTVGLVPSGISAILRAAGAPSGWSGVIVDADGKIVASTTAEGLEIGRTASSPVLDALAHGSEGFYGGRAADGAEIETVYRTLSRPIGWSVHFGIPAAALNEPVLRSLFALGLGGATSLALGCGIAWLVARDIAQRRNEEHARAALALSVSEERGAVAVEAANLGTWRWDMRRDEVIGSERSALVLHLPKSDVGAPEAVWSTEEFLSVFERDHRERIRSAVMRCFHRNEPVDLEARATQPDGTPHWVRLSGRLPAGGSEEAIHGVISDIEPQKRAQAERQRLLRTLSEAQELEQRRIARELHDQVGQTLTGLALGLKSLERELDAGSSSPEMREQIQWLRRLANEIGRDIHRAASDLRPTAIDDLGLRKALAALTEEWSRHAPAAVDFQGVGPLDRLPVEIATCLYRVVQEALTNIAKHAEARTVSIIAEVRDGVVRAVIEDDGQGMNVDLPADSVLRDEDGRTRLGLIGMRERLAALGGTLTVESTEGVGTTLFVEVPLDQPVTPS